MDWLSDRWLDPTSLSAANLPERITSAAQLRKLSFVRDELIIYEEPTEENLRICERISDLMVAFYRDRDSEQA